MPWIETPHGPMHVRMARSRMRNCTCGRFAPLQCDWPEPERKSGTCDKPICKVCAWHVADEVDYCPFHRGDPPKPPPTQAELDLAGEEAANEAARILGVKR